LETDVITQRVKDSEPPLKVRREMKTPLALLTLLSVALAAPALAQDLEGVATAFTVTHSGKNLGTKASSGNKTISATVNRVWTQLDPVQDQVLTYVCPQGVGKSPLWNAFYNAKKEDKPAALAAAIRGVGQSTAEKLVDMNTFHTKPKSWDDFADRILDADGVLRTGFSKEVLFTYGSENAERLGYSATYGCSYQYRTVTRLELRKHSQFYATNSRQFRVDIEGGALLNGEQETFTVHYDGLNEPSLTATQSYNTYTLSVTQEGPVKVFSLRGQRKQIQASNVASAALVREGGKLVLKGSIPGYDSTLPNGGSAYVNISIKENSFWSADKEVYAGQVLVNNDGSFSSDAIPGKSGQKYIGTYSLQYVGSAYYGAGPTGANDTARLKF
jgi:hypothetical protein